ncbi:MAG: bifunctional homocysteine S-methyltransferase/methylenetetrahydrofolate reductase [Pirellulales bacterium]|nr:bifunctional homocysteine S-methyltransferase/methylenetetrahydrofolate reductase [Pirellulales bacterium]
MALSRGVLVFDGAMGTELYRHHVFTNRSFEELSLSDPKLIRTIHAEYRDAGADVLTTNTFGANRIALAHFGLGEKAREINRAGAKLAREVADQAERPLFVAGSIGPLPSQSQYEFQIEDLILEQVESLTAGGADFILFETQPNRAALEKCAAAMGRMPDTPFVLSFTLEANGETAAGETVERLMAPLPEGSPSPVAWGMNCGSGPDGLLSAVERAVRLTTLPLIVQPNAGMPKEVDNRRIYLCSPEYLTEYAKRFVGLGAAAVGGCCGTTPEHIRAMAQAIKPLSRMKSKPTVVIAAAKPAEGKPPLPFAEKSNLARRLAEKKWVTTVELVPPRGYDLRSTVEKSRALRERGVTAINIPDGPRASARISPLITAEHILREAGIEPILHFCCRDRNLIGMQADLLACAACGIRNLLFVTGDPPKLGDYPHATGVFDADSIGMAAVQRRLNEGLDLGGQPIDPQTFAVIGVGLDPTALDRKRELDRFRRKVEAGAEFAITQPVFDPDALLRFFDEVEQFEIPILAGIWPLTSYRNAAFMRNEVPGVTVPDAVMERMASVESREGQMAMGIEIARESVARIRDRVAGIQVSAPFGRIETALAVIEGEK